MTKGLVAVGVLLAVGSLQAQQINWSGGSSTNWQDPANWAGGNVPDASGEYANFNYATVPTLPLLLNGDVTLGATSPTAPAIRYASGSTTLTISGANTPSNNTLTLLAGGGQYVSIDGGAAGQIPRVIMDSMNVVFNNASGSAGTLAVGRSGVLTLGSATNVTIANGSRLNIAAVRDGDAGTVNINSASFNAGSSNTFLTVDQGTVNFGAGSFSTTAATPTLAVTGKAKTSVVSPATLNFTSNYSSGTTSGMIRAGSGNVSSAVVVSAENGVKVTDAVEVAGYGNAGVTNSVVIGVTAANSTATFGGVHVEQYNNAGNTTTVSFAAASGSTAVFTGSVQGWRHSGITTGTTVFTKTGAGTVIFAGNDTTMWHDGNYAAAAGGAFDIQEGKLVLKSTASYAGASAMYINSIVRSGAILELGASNQITNTASLTLNGGTFDANNFAETLGELIVSANSFLSIDAGALLAFASSQSDWGLNTLNITGTLDTQGIRFGTDSTGLLASNVDNLLYNGVAGLIGIDSSGYLTAIPEPSTAAFLIASVFGLGWVSRRRRTANI